MIAESTTMYATGGSTIVSCGGGSISPDAGGADDLNSRRPKPVVFWNNGEVMKWLKRHCEEFYDLYGNVFLENEITGRSLIRINTTTLERMGIQNAEHRDQIARIILKLKLKSDIIEVKDLERKQPATSDTSTSSNSEATTIVNKPLHPTLKQFR